MVLVALGVIGESLADFIDRKNMKPLCQCVEIQAPVFGAIRSIVRAKMTAMIRKTEKGEKTLNSFRKLPTRIVCSRSSC